MSDQSKKNRRRLKRIVKRVPARFQSHGLIGQGHIKNITKEGLFLRTDRLPARGAPVRVIFEPPHGPKVEVEGTVRWTTAQLPPSQDSAPGFGMKIDAVPEEFLEFFEQTLLR
jgi:hypothetical protein